MSASIKGILNGIINMTSTKSDSETNREKETTMYKITTNIPEIDKENDSLMKASALLESINNSPGLTATEFYKMLIEGGVPVEDHDDLTLAAIAIETMMTMDLDLDLESPPTVH